MAVKLAYTLYRPVDKIKSTIPVIVTHALFGHRGNWNHVGQTLADKTQCEVYTVDARNHGESPRVINCNFIDMAEDMLKFLDDHSIKQCNLFGHSMGGLTSIALSLLQPSRVKTLAVVDVSPIAAPKSMLEANSSFVNAMRKVMKKLHAGLSLEMAQTICNNELERLQIHSSMRPVLTSNLRKVGDNFISLCDFDILDVRFAPDMHIYPKFNVSNNLPTIFIRGEKPTYLKVEHEAEIQKLFPKVTFQYIMGASHQVQLDRPDELIEVYLKFFLKNNLNSHL